MGSLHEVGLTQDNLPFDELIRDLICSQSGKLIMGVLSHHIHGSDPPFREEHYPRTWIISGHFGILSTADVSSQSNTFRV